MENKKITNLRDGENQETPYRSGRFYSVENEWFYSVREKEDQGPFSCKLSAENNLKIYLKDNEYFKVNEINLINDSLKII